MNVLTYSAVVVNDISDSLINSIDVWYYLSSSPTQLLGGKWSTTAPEWVDGYYYWQKTITTYADDSTSETDPVCISGKSGATGTGIESLTEEYYLSTSKETQIDGTWSTTPPEWVYGKYMWTRTKIVYNNPYSVDYTKPVCDTSWEALNEIEIGGRNLILNSTFKNEEKNWEFNNTTRTFGKDEVYGNYVKFSSASAGDTGTNRLCTTKFANGLSHQANKLYTLSFYAKASVNNSKIHAGWVSGLTQFIITTTWQRYFVTYTPTSTGSLTFYIDAANIELYLSQVQLEYGNQVTDWTPAPEDIENQITTITDTISDVQLKVDSNTKSITSKVWQSDISTSINNYDGSTIKSIRDRVASTETDISGIKTTLSDVQTTVSKKADGSTVQTLNTKVSTMESDFNGFKTTVSETYATKTDFNNLEIGGRQILLNTKTMKDYYKDYDATITNDSEDFAVVTWPSRDTLVWRGVASRPPITFSKVRGKTVTFSVYVRSDDYESLNADTSHGLCLSIGLCTATSELRTLYAAKSYYITEIMDEWKKIAWTATLTDDFFVSGSGTIEGDSRLICYVFNYSTYSMQFRQCKLELGNKATDWTPAPEDVEQSITNVSSQYTQLADKFNWVVKSGTSASDFTITDRMATLVSNYINLKGLVTFSGLDSTAQSKITTAQSTADSAKTAAANAQSKADSLGVVHSVSGNGNTNMYIHFATISTTNTYLNYTISFRVISRGYEASNVQIQFVSQNAADPNISYFRANGDVPLYMVKSATSTWYVIMKKNEPYGNCVIDNYYNASGAKVTWVSNHLASLPSGYISSSWLAEGKLAQTVKSTVDNGKSNWDTAYSWTNTNGSNMTSLLSMVKKWTNNAVSDTTTINGGWISTNTITASQIASGAIITSKLATDAIKSTNYSYSSGNFSSAGTFLDLSTGLVRSKNFAIDSSGNAYFKGNIQANAGYIGGTSGWAITTNTITGNANSKIISGILESSNYVENSTGVQMNLNTGIIKGNIEATTLAAKDALQIYVGNTKRNVMTGYVGSGFFYTILGCDLTIGDVSRVNPSIILNKSTSSTSVSDMITINTEALDIYADTTISGSLVANDVYCNDVQTRTGWAADRLSHGQTAYSNLMSGRISFNWAQNSSGLWKIYVYVDGTLVRSDW